jgi:1-acyl-sn-glycerol-3-phosphate acyltransferase
MIAALRGSLRAFAFIVWTLGVGAGWLVCRVFLPCRHRAAGGAMTLHVWSRGLCVLLGIRIAVTGQPCAAPSLRVGNHIGYLDIIVLSATSPALFVSKDDLASWPILGYLGKSVGTIFLDRTRPRAVAEVSAQMASLFANNIAVIVFPEGTTTDGGEVAPFHSSLFEPALRAGGADGIPVQAVALCYTARDARDPATLAAWTGDATFLPHFWKLLRSRGVSVSAHYAAPATGAQDRRAAAAAARAWIAASLHGGGGEPAADGLRDGAGFMHDGVHEIRRVRNGYGTARLAQERQVVGRVADGQRA